MAHFKGVKGPLGWRWVAFQDVMQYEWDQDMRRYLERWWLLSKDFEMGVLVEYYNLSFPLDGEMFIGPGEVNLIRWLES